MGKLSTIFLLFSTVLSYLAPFRFISAGSDVFIVGITGNMLKEDVDYFRHCGANAVLPKPFQLSALEQLWVEYGLVG